MAGGEASSFRVQSYTEVNRLFAEREDIEEEILKLQVR